jgi:hypothetical protein
LVRDGTELVPNAIPPVAGALVINGVTEFRRIRIYAGSSVVAVAARSPGLEFTVLLKRARRVAIAV